MARNRNLAAAKKAKNNEFCTQPTSKRFVLTMPLRYEPWQRDYLDKIFRVAGNMYNNLVADRKKALEQLERTRKWRTVQSSLRAAYKAVGDSKTKKIQALCAERNELLRAYGFSDYAFQARIKKWRNPYAHLIGSKVAQKIASAVWRQFEAYLFGNGRHISFKPHTEFRSIEGKTNGANIRYKEDRLFIGKKLSIPVVAARNDYEREALSCKVKYCRIVRVPWKDGGWLYRLQLTLEGTPPVKRRDDGTARHAIGSGRTGIDIGTQTVAIVGDSALELSELAPKANLQEKMLRRVMRKMDRSRRATNPAFFNQETGEVIRRDKLPPELLDGRGRRKWVESKGYRRLAGQRRYLYAKLARTRRCEHQAMANRFLAHGGRFFVETMNFKALAKKAKRQPPAPGEKEKRRKRFGKSVGNKAPALFLDILDKKVQDGGGSFYRIQTWAAKASQYDHTNGTYQKKSLSARWARLSDGHRVQRDLYSAYLLKNTNDTLDGFVQHLLEEGFELFLDMHDKEVERLSHIRTPSSTGVKYLSA